MASSANAKYGKKDHNYTMMQAFEWYVPGGGVFWKDLESKVPHLSDIGITAMWLPPPTKASGKVCSQKEVPRSHRIDDQIGLGRL
jgi:alpha-amylase